MAVRGDAVGDRPNALAAVRRVTDAVAEASPSSARWRAQPAAADVAAAAAARGRRARGRPWAALLRPPRTLSRPRRRLDEVGSGGGGDAGDEFDPFSYFSSSWRRSAATC